MNHKPVAIELKLASKGHMDTNQAHNSTPHEDATLETNAYRQAFSQAVKWTLAGAALPAFYFFPAGFVRLAARDAKQREAGSGYLWGSFSAVLVWSGLLVCSFLLNTFLNPFEGDSRKQLAKDQPSFFEKEELRRKNKSSLTNPHRIPTPSAPDTVEDPLSIKENPDGQPDATQIESPLPPENEPDPMDLAGIRDRNLEEEEARPQRRKKEVPEAEDRPQQKGPDPVREEFFEWKDRMASLKNRMAKQKRIIESSTSRIKKVKTQIAFYQQRLSSIPTSNRTHVSQGGVSVTVPGQDSRPKLERNIAALRSQIRRWEDTRALAQKIQKELQRVLPNYQKRFYAARGQVIRSGADPDTMHRRVFREKRKAGKVRHILTLHSGEQLHAEQKVESGDIVMIKDRSGAFKTLTRSEIAKIMDVP